MIKTKPNEEIKKFLEPYAESAEIELVEVEFKKGATAELVVYIDTEKGVDLDTLERFHNMINDPLDELDPSYGAPYNLSVSSLGIDRPLKTERDFKKAMGEKLEVKLFAPIKGKKHFEGILKGFDKSTVTITVKTKDGEFDEKFELNKIAKISRVIEF